VRLVLAVGKSKSTVLLETDTQYTQNSCQVDSWGGDSAAETIDGALLPVKIHIGEKP
jgi:hypothetical protein